MNIEGNIVDVHSRRIFYGQIRIENSKIIEINDLGQIVPSSTYVIPGFVDAHIHIESSMVPPSEFIRIALAHGTIASVSDPHEIANVLGVEGVHYMIENAKNLPFYVCFGAPSCVPATSFETSGATLESADVQAMLKLPEIGYLSEMMNYPGVLSSDPSVLEKIKAALQMNMPVDGHAPGLMGDDAISYINAGISTDHECFSLEEATFKIKNGMKVIIREGSAAKNFEALWSLIDSFPDKVMLCSDDKHPDDLFEGHINTLAARAIKKGCNVFNVLRVACMNPVEHYQLPIGLLRVGDEADFTIVKDLQSFLPLSTWWKGTQVAKNGKSILPFKVPGIVNKFYCSEKEVHEFEVLTQSDHHKVRVIKAIDGELITRSEYLSLHTINGRLEASIPEDVLHISVVNRYQDQPPANGFIRGFGLINGAIASTVSHDSHNIIAVGVNPEEVCAAVNQLIHTKGGICAISGDQILDLPLPIAGLMSDQPIETVAQNYCQIDLFTKRVLGSTLTSPFMTLSFMALLVIPELKMSDKGLFNVSEFTFTSLDPEVSE